MITVTDGICIHHPTVISVLICPIICMRAITQLMYMHILCLNPVETVVQQVAIHTLHSHPLTRLFCLKQQVQPMFLSWQMMSITLKNIHMIMVMVHLRQVLTSILVATRRQNLMLINHCSQAIHMMALRQMNTVICGISIPHPMALSTLIYHIMRLKTMAMQLTFISTTSQKVVAQAEMVATVVALLRPTLTLLQTQVQGFQVMLMVFTM